MIIETKFNIFDKVYFIKENQIREDKIIVIQTTISEFGITYVYYLEFTRGEGFKENKLFSTREELTNTL